MSFASILCIRRRNIEGRISIQQYLKVRNQEENSPKDPEKWLERHKGKKGNVIEATGRKYFEKEGRGRGYRTNTFCSKVKSKKHKYSDSQEVICIESSFREELKMETTKVS